MLLFSSASKKAKLNEGLNLIYILKAKSVKQLLDPIEDFPQATVPYFKDYLDRRTYQINPITLTTLYTVRKLIDRSNVL